MVGTDLFPPSVTRAAALSFSLAQQAQDVQCSSNSVLLFSIVAWRVWRTSRSLENRGLCILDPLQQLAPVRPEDRGAVKLFPILLGITGRTGMTSVVIMKMNRAHLDLRATAYNSLNDPSFLLLVPSALWVIGANMQCKFFVALQLEVAHHFIERCARGRTRRLEPPAAFGAAKAPETL